MSQVSLLDTINGNRFILNSSEKLSENDPLKVYICGPTVYTHTHIGHLKTYMTFDIIRRVLEDYFRIPMHYMMNITNVDDKIIKGVYEEEYGFPNNYNYDNLPKENILENEKFIEFADKWEKDFFRVMDKMGIKRPDTLSRVTDYIDEILNFVDEIDKKGYAFEEDGSVYFYGTKYEGINNTENTDYSKDPNHPLNFVLLKKTRQYEPGWMSKWGSVRPGWHIECSAMASSVFGDNMHIHAGGVDLKFPHHQNELFQSNARFGLSSNETSHGWVEHFMHTGHLNIKGLKMSRSLKNFITVEEALKHNTPDNLRMLFLIHTWCVPMDYSDDTMEHAEFYTDLFTNFFVQINSILLRQSVKENKKFTNYEIDALDKLFKTMDIVDTYLRDNLDTPNTIKTLHDLIKYLFKYVTTLEEDNLPLSREIIIKYENYIKRILCMFGFTIGVKETNTVSEDTSAALLKVISDIRTEIRSVAKIIDNKLKQVDKNIAKEVTKDLYSITDKIRDQMLADIDIKITDK